MLARLVPSAGAGAARPPHRRRGRLGAGRSRSRTARVSAAHDRSRSLRRRAIAANARPVRFGTPSLSRRPETQRSRRVSARQHRARFRGRRRRGAGRAARASSSRTRRAAPSTCSPSACPAAPSRRRRRSSTARPRSRPARPAPTAARAGAPRRVGFPFPDQAAPVRRTIRRERAPASSARRTAAPADAGRRRIAPSPRWSDRASTRSCARGRTRQPPPSPEQAEPTPAGPVAPASGDRGPRAPAPPRAERAGETRARRSATRRHSSFGDALARVLVGELRALRDRGGRRMSLRRPRRSGDARRQPSHRCRGRARRAAGRARRRLRARPLSAPRSAAALALADVDAGATAVVELGYGDDLETVLTGTVTSVDAGSGVSSSKALAATVSLSRTYLGRSYVSSPSGDIVTDLVGGANADVGEVSAPLELSAFHVDERRSVWSHVCALAQLAGCELSADGEGALNFRPPKSGTPDHSFRHGAEVVALGRRAARHDSHRRQRRPVRRRERAGIRPLARTAARAGRRTAERRDARRGRAPRP